MQFDFGDFLGGGGGGFDNFGLPDFTQFTPPPTGADLLSDFGGGGGIFGGAQMFFDTQTGQIVSAQQAQQLDPAAYQAVLQNLNQGRSALQTAGQQFPNTGGGGGMTPTQMAALGLIGTSALTGIGGLAYTLARGTPRVPPAPSLSAEQQRLLAAQTGVLNQTQQLLGQQAAVGQASLPALMARAGLVSDTAGGMHDIYGAGIQNATLGNLGLTGQYQNLAARAGSEDLTKINPALTQYLNDQQTLSEAQARSQFGPGYQQAQPYQQQQYYQNLAKTNALVGNQLNYEQAYQNLANAAFTGSQVSPGSAAGALQTAGGPAAQLGNVAAAFQNPYANLSSQQLLGYQGQLNAYNANVAQNAAIGGALGQFAGGLGQLGTGLAGGNALAALMGGRGGGYG